MNEIEKLRSERPELAVRVRWTHDPYFDWDGFGPDPSKEGLYPHTVEVKAFAVVNGELEHASAYLGGCYSPLEGPHCPDVHGYLDQLVEEAVSELDKIITKAKQ